MYICICIYIYVFVYVYIYMLLDDELAMKVIPVW